MHVSIIMDGNGRWAGAKGLDRLAGHKEGIESVRVVAEYAAERGIEYLSFYAFSEENWGRPQYEVDGLMDLMAGAIINERETIMKNNICFRIIGNRARLSAKVLSGVEDMERASSANSGLNMIIFLSYSGKWDIVQAVNKFIEERGDRERFTPEAMDACLATAGVPDPDLIIRTSGEQRISNYLLWQSAYSEFYYTDVLWPDFRKIDFDKALETYSKRERRYGKTEQQINKTN